VMISLTESLAPQPQQHDDPAGEADAPG